MNAIDKLVGWFSPIAGLRRHAARQALARYEAAEPSTQRKFYRETMTANQLAKKSAKPLRDQARHLQRNHDISRGALRTFANNVVGANGIGIEPQPRLADGSIHQAYADLLQEAFRDWSRRPEVTKRFPWSRVQRLGASTWARDGEYFAQTLAGPVPGLNHGTRVPYSIELLETDMIPGDYDGQYGSNKIRQACERNAWGEPVAWWAYKTSPDDAWVAMASDLKRIPAERMLHVAAMDRMHQIRGVSEFASIITRLEDIKDYEESERVAAKIAAMLTAYVKKGAPDLYAAGDGDAPRSIKLTPGTIIDSLGVGEEIGLIDSKRPNPNVVTFRQGQLRAAAAGFPISYSSLSRDYGGTYSAQRQELVEQYAHYACAADDFVGMFVQPVWEEFVLVAHLSGIVPRPKDLRPGSDDDALYIAQAMPWIDPLKEAMASEALVAARLASQQEMIRRRGAKPGDVLEQTKAWEQQTAAAGITGTTTSRPDLTQAAIQAAARAAIQN